MKWYVYPRNKTNMYFYSAELHRNGYPSWNKELLYISWNLFFDLALDQKFRTQIMPNFLVIKTEDLTVTNPQEVETPEAVIVNDDHTARLI